MPTIDAIAGSATANSYLDLGTADQLIDQRPDRNASWLALSDDQKSALLISATDLIDVYAPYKGNITNDDQRLAFPRTGLQGLNGNKVDDSAIPYPVQLACSELAWTLTTTDLFAEAGTEGFSELKVSSLQLKINASDRTGNYTSTVRKYLLPFIDGAGTNTVKVLRV